MPLQILHQDITTVCCDAIVNPTDCYYSGGGGTDQAIHTAAGIEMEEACSQLESLDFGEVSVTPGFDLPVKYVIHTVGPIWNGGLDNEPALLRSCYLNALLKAGRLKAKSIAFPLISSGAFGFPKDKVLRIAIDAISDFLFAADSEMDVCICVINRDAFELSKDIALKEYLSRNSRFVFEDNVLKMQNGSEKNTTESGEETPDRTSDGTLADILKHHDDSFAVLLLKLIDLKGMDDVECYKKANVNKNTFWKINNDPKYRPSKATVIAFAIALELTLDETNALLKSAGFAFSGSNVFDMIIEFYIKNGIYDIFEINAALYQYDQTCLGC